MNRIAIISSDYLETANPNEKDSFENLQLRESVGNYFDEYYFVSPADISIEIRSSIHLDGASISVMYNEPGKGQIDLCSFSAILIRRTRGFAEQVYDIVDALSMSGNVLIVDNPECFVRPLSKIGPYLQRWGKFHQPDMIISMNKTVPKPLPIPFPLTIKPTHGFRGKEVETCNNNFEVENYVTKYSGNEYGYGLIIQEHLKNHEEYRVFVIGGKAIGCVLKDSDDLDAKNAYRGAEFHRREVSDVIKTAERCSISQKIDIAGVDVLRHNGNLYILECNRNPEFKKFQSATGINVGDKILAYVKERCKEQQTIIQESLETKPSYQSPTNNISILVNTSQNTIVDNKLSQLNEIQNKYGLTSEDIKSLEAAIQNDKEIEDQTKKKTKQSVANWLGERMSKVIDKVGPDTALKLSEFVLKNIVS